jgi:hypothetical protein
MVAGGLETTKNVTAQVLRATTILRVICSACLHLDANPKAKHNLRFFSSEKSLGWSEILDRVYPKTSKLRLATTEQAFSIFDQATKTDLRAIRLGCLLREYH